MLRIAGWLFVGMVIGSFFPKAIDMSRGLFDAGAATIETAIVETTGALK